MLGHDLPDDELRITPCLLQALPGGGGHVDDDVRPAKAELAQREERHDRSIMARLWAAPENRKNRRDEENERLDRQAAERRAFHQEIRTALNEKARAAHEQKVKAGMIYEPTGGWDADAAAAVFSSDLLWRWAEWGLHPDGDGAFTTGVIVAVDDLIATYWIMNLIAENEGAVRVPNGQFPRYPTDAGGNRIGTPSLGRLQKLGLIEREDGPGYTTVTLGTRTRELQRQFREGWTARAKGEAK